MYFFFYYVGVVGFFFFFLYRELNYNIINFVSLDLKVVRKYKGRYCITKYNYTFSDVPGGDKIVISINDGSNLLTIKINDQDAITQSIVWIKYIGKKASLYNIGRLCSRTILNNEIETNNLTA